MVKATLLSQIRDRLGDPYQVDQGPQPFCGPAAIVFELVRKRPWRYVQYCHELYETGGFQGFSKRVGTSSKLRNSRKPAAIADVDWMLMAAMRESENWLFDVDVSGGLIANGVTTPWEMKIWAGNVLGAWDVSYTSTYFWGEADALRVARDRVSAGGVGFLLIHSAMLPGRPEPWISYPEHWVALLGNVSIRDSDWYWTWWGPRYREAHFWFDVYSWGGRHSVDIGEGGFEDYFWGTVTGQM
jgi:hypothetical protein